MTTDDFTEAARAEAVKWWQTPVSSPGNVIEQLGQHMAEWARAHLAAQEPHDAEVLAALNAAHPTYAKNNLRLWGVLAVEQMRAALSAARAARRDEEQNHG